jgi:hypothetical protein
LFKVKIGTAGIAGTTGTCDEEGEESDDDFDLTKINPFASMAAAGTSTNCTKKNNIGFGGTANPPKKMPRHSYVASASRNSTKKEGTVVEETTRENSNSTTGFTPHYMSFVYKNKKKQKYCVLIISIPSGLCTDGNLDGKIMPKVVDGNSLTLHCEWPDAITDQGILVDALESEVDGDMSMGRLIIAFEQELDLIRDKMGLESFEGIGGTATIPLPFDCEGDIVLVNPKICGRTGACNLYVYLKARADSTKNNSYSFKATIAASTEK